MPISAAPMPWGPASPYPTQPTRYAQFWRSGRWQWWKSLLVLGVGAVSFFLLSLIVTGVFYAAGWIKSVSTTSTTPALFISNNVMLALLVPTCLLMAWALTGQRPGYLSSMTGRLRWGWLGRCLLFLSPLWLVMAGLEAWSSYHDPEMNLHINPSTYTLIVAILLTTPLQCAGEEYAFRGLVNRSVGAWFSREPVAFVAGGLVSTILFMLSHAAGDIWLNVVYFLFGGVAAWMARRTGGLEASIAMHVVNNMTAEWTLPFTDISGLFNRDAGTAGPGVLLQALPLVLGALVIEWLARRHGIVGVQQPPNQAQGGPGSGAGVANYGVPASPYQNAPYQNAPYQNAPYQNAPWQGSLPPQQFPPQQFPPAQQAYPQQFPPPQFGQPPARQYPPPQQTPGEADQPHPWQRPE